MGVCSPVARRGLTLLRKKSQIFLDTGDGVPYYLGMNITTTSRRAKGRAWIAFGSKSSYIDLDKPGADPLALVLRERDPEGGYRFSISVKGEFAEYFKPESPRRATEKAEARAMSLLAVAR